MEEAATATAVAAEKTTSYRYWAREATGDAADLAANPAPATLGSVWNQVRFLSLTCLLPGCEQNVWNTVVFSVL